MNRLIRILTLSLLLAAFTLSACTARTAPTPTPRVPEAIPTPTPALRAPLALAPRAPEGESGVPAGAGGSDLAPFFHSLPGAFVLYDLNHDSYFRYNPARCAERFLPASTFKIMNALIGLETAVIPDENYLIPWNGTHYDIPVWNQDHTLKTAIQNSVVWYFQELAWRVGTQKMQFYIDAVGYGNQDISGHIDSFWLDGALRISADEQVAFLKRLYLNDLPFMQRSMTIVKSIIVLDHTPDYTFSGKTGTVQRLAVHTGWFVGYLETGGNVYFFATNLESTAPDGLATGAEAQNITTRILQSLGLLP